MKKAILLDFWGTLVEQGVWSPIKQTKNILGIRLPFPEYVVRMEKAMMTHKFDSLKTAFKNVCKEFEITCSNNKIEELIGMWNKSWMLAKPYGEVNEELKKLKKKYKLILVSNTDPFSINHVLDKFGLRVLFDNLYLSCELGMIKTDPNFLKKVLEDNNLQPEECVFIGDSIQSDINSAKSAGIKAILIDRKESREFSLKIKNLKELEPLLH